MAGAPRGDCGDPYRPGWYGTWLTCALAFKLAPTLWALHLRVRLGLGHRATALGVSTIFLAASGLMLPYTRFRVPHSLGIAGDEPHYLTVTANLLSGGGFWVGKAYTNGTFARVFGSAIPYSQWRAHTGLTVTGHFGSGHDLGLSLFALPFFAAGGTKAVMIAMAFVAGLAVYET